MSMGTGGDRDTFRTKTGWGQSGNLITGNKTQRVTMQADFNKGVGAFDFTVQFNITPPLGGVANAEALVHWRVEGQEVTRRVTIGAGTTLTGVGQAVRVEIVDATPPQFTNMIRLPGTATVTAGSDDVTFSDPAAIAKILSTQASFITLSSQPNVQYAIAGFGGPNTITVNPAYSGPSSTTAKAIVDVQKLSLSYGVSVQVSAGIRAGSGQPPLLQPFDGPPYIDAFGPGNPSPGTGFLFIVAAGDVRSIRIPEDAGANQIFVTAAFNSKSAGPLPPGKAAVLIDNDLAPQRLWDPQVNTQWVPIPPGAQSLTLENNVAPGGDDIVFSVTFGIDG